MAEGQIADGRESAAAECSLLYWDVIDLNASSSDDLKDEPKDGSMGESGDESEDESEDRPNQSKHQSRPAPTLAAPASTLAAARISTGNPRARVSPVRPGFPPFFAGTSYAHLLHPRPISESDLEVIRSAKGKGC
ncbi:hypothetical protein BDV93DRAFT_557748 [Ceratobasidium sp. AG-I]|nr:hypothetical protein BDV93DRAFT_557748 [Ceratobasidium sp. AG-I]